MPRKEKVAPEGYKYCSRAEQCVNPLGALLPATSEHFPPDKRAKTGLACRCRACDRNAGQKYRDENRQTINKRHREQYADDPTPFMRRTERWQRKNPHKLRQASKRYALNHPETVLARTRHWNANNPDKKKQSYQNWIAKKPLSLKVNLERRRSRKKSVHNKFTLFDMERALEYFNNRCAICGRSAVEIPSTNRIVFDHWIPLRATNQCPGTVPENMIPMCHGVGGCNNSKHGKLPMDWLLLKFDPDVAYRIFNRVNKYFRDVINF